MNSRGQVNKILLGAAIFVALLALLFMGPLGEGGFGKIQNFFDNTPGFNDTKQATEKIALVRYDILADKVRSYDGESWGDLQKEISFSGLKNPTTEQELNDAFESYFFKSQRTGNVIYENADSSATAIDIADSEFISENFWDFNAKVFSRGATAVNVKPTGKPILGSYYINLDGTIKYKENDGQATREPYSEEIREQIRLKAITWRDSVFAKPEIIIQGKSFCLKKVGTSYLSENRYLIADLNKAGEKCNV
jgi:hypothetical protein